MTGKWLDNQVNEEVLTLAFNIIDYNRYGHQIYWIAYPTFLESVMGVGDAE